MRKSKIISVVSEVICAAGLSIMGFRKGFDWFLGLAIGLNVLALVLNLLTWRMEEDNNE